MSEKSRLGRRGSLDGEWLAAGEAQARDHDDGVGSLEIERGRHPSSRRLDLGRDRLDRAGATLTAQLGREAGRAAPGSDGARLGHERPACPPDDAAQQAVALEVAERLAHRHPADAERLGQVALGRKAGAGSERARRDRGRKLFRNRHVQRLRAALQHQVEGRIHARSVLPLEPYCLDRCDDGVMGRSVSERIGRRRCRGCRRLSSGDAKQPIHRDMRHAPRWLKAIALISLAAEATAAAAVFWHSR